MIALINEAGDADNIGYTLMQSGARSHQRQKRAAVLEDEMCNLAHEADRRFGFIVDTPQIRELIDETQRLMRIVSDDGTRVDRLRPAFCAIAGGGWLAARRVRET